ncbi:multidrug effflux MFS transporter [Acuticoccus sp. M5D2P5]|uniref:multidrug effflux MFS transporter n=1 Tax=Acuticoccus kalidii TaxID=2910977 RepID=UPI001F1596A0|nr:multidrug effflux MFS transporter [Acuticoccus kalidii]MCF3935817.1 multidrug effflux MFS transporter [Acuticoccus kalidii]
MTRGAQGLGLSMAEFVTMMAMMMALTALSVDIMLVALPSMASDFGLTDPNQQQFIVTVYLMSFAAGHLFAGPISDRFGRRPVILGGLVIYSIGAILAVVAESFTVLLVARVIQGLGAAGPRVVAVAVIRDNFSGRAMSQVMSFVMTVFIMVPIIAPALGSFITLVGSWHLIFVFLLAFAIVGFGWIYMRLRETNPELAEGETRAGVRVAIRTMVGSRQTVGYVLSLGFVFGCLMNYVATSQQLFADIYGIVDWFPLVFASGAGAMVVSSLVNARLVQRLGMRFLSHGALLLMVALAGLMSIVMAVMPIIPVFVFLPFIILCFFLVGLILPNFNAIAMEPLGRVAGTGAAFVGFVMTGAGAILGGTLGQLYDQTVHPMILGYFIYASIVLIIVTITEKGRILQPSQGHSE